MARSVFISYSHKDAAWKDRLVTHLAGLQRQGLLSFWEDHGIAAGADWRHEIEKAVSEAQVAVLLVSADFLASKFIAEAEVPALLDRAKRESLRIVPILIEPCAWRTVSWLEPLQLWTRDNGKALSTASRRAQ